MAGFLDQYGAADERRGKIIKAVVISAVTLAVAAGLLYFFFHNYRQEQQVKTFFDLLEHQKYQEAYSLWVRTDSDRRGYPFESFMQDWGPQSGHRDVSSFQIAKN